MRIRLSTLRRIIRETVEEQMGMDPLKSFLNSDLQGHVVHTTSRDGVVRVGSGGSNDPEVPANVADELAGLVAWGGGSLNLNDLRKNLENYRSLMAAGKPYPDRTVFGQRPRRVGSKVFTTAREPASITSYGPGDPQTWPSHLRGR